MREYELLIDQALKNGLAPEKFLPANSPFLYNALGFRCGKGGLESSEYGSNPLPGIFDVHYNWPFPQVIDGEKYRFFIMRDMINLIDYIYTLSLDNQTMNFVFAVDELTYGPGGTIFEVADFGKYAFLTNGICMVYWDACAWSAMTGSATIPLIGTICNFKGQMVGGNVKSTWYDCDEEYYIWGRIGSADFTPDEENEAGFRRDLFGGIVRHVRRLGDVVIGYSSKGVIQMFPVNDPAPTFGFRELVNVGIINLGAMNGDDKKQVYVGEDYVLRYITKEGVKELGYQYYIEQLAGEDIIVTYDKLKENFYIGNSSKTFILSPYGMTECLQHPSAVWKNGQDLFMLPPDIDSDNPLISSEVIDFMYKGQKTIATVETDVVGVTSPRISIDYSNDLSTWKTTSTSPVNNNGVGTKSISGERFRFNLSFASILDSFRIGFMKVRFKMTDLRSIRGVVAPPSSLRGQE